MTAPRPNEITVQVHPPERGRPPAVVAPCCCCCCCCCCLHSVGGIVGAAIPSVMTTGRAGAGAYWLTLAVVTALGLMAGALSFLSMDSSGEWMGGAVIEAVVLLLVMPGVQLAAAVIALGVVGLGPSEWFRDRAACLAAVGKITLGTVVGTVVGLVVMGVPVLFLYLANR